MSREEALKERVSREIFGYEPEDVEYHSGSFLKHRKNIYGYAYINGVPHPFSSNCGIEDCKNDGVCYLFNVMLQDHCFSKRYGTCEKHLNDVIELILGAAIKSFEVYVVKGYRIRF